MGKTKLLAIAVIAASATAVQPAARAADGTISTEFASYGYAMNRKDVKDVVAKACDGKSACTFKASSDVLGGDPSPGDDKGLMVVWKCGDAQHKEQFAEGKDVHLDCGAK